MMTLGSFSTPKNKAKQTQLLRDLKTNLEKTKLAPGQAGAIQQVIIEPYNLQTRFLERR